MVLPKVNIVRTTASRKRKQPVGERNDSPSLLFPSKEFIAIKLEEPVSSFQCDMSAALTMALVKAAELLEFKARAEDFWSLLSGAEKEIVLKYQPRFATWVDEDRKEERSASLTFQNFKHGPAGWLCRRAGLSLEAIETWSEYSNHFQERNKKTNGNVVERLLKLPVSSGEASVIQAILHAADYSRFADDHAHNRAWDRLSGVYDEHAEAVAAAILRRD
ncbi:hypothetical protein [Agrobacterium rosae]|uniref:hypothetical protein n=1 Tax=Agrobacterium rosae TaxID=1972867 RepID=UPI003BA30C57